jgi:hypothetical protein
VLRVLFNQNLNRKVSGAVNDIVSESRPSSLGVVPELLTKPGIGLIVKSTRCSSRGLHRPGLQLIAKKKEENGEFP